MSWPLRRKLVSARSLKTESYVPIVVGLGAVDELAFNSKARSSRIDSHSRRALSLGGEQSQKGIPLAEGIAFSPDLTGEFDPGSERTLAARLTHASRTRQGQPC